MNETPRVVLLMIPFALWQGFKRRYSGLSIAFLPLFVLGLGGTWVYAGGAFTSIGGLDRNHLAALDAATGANRWSWHLDEGERGRVAPRRMSGRGVAFWTDGTSQRIFTITARFVFLVYKLLRL